MVKNPLLLAERDARGSEMEKLYIDDKLTLKQVGALWGVTRERVRQILKERGVKSRARGSGREKIILTKKCACGCGALIYNADNYDAGHYRKYILAPRDDKIVKLYESGHSSFSISEKLKIGRNKVTIGLKRRKVKMRTLEEAWVCWRKRTGKTRRI